jgi:ATP-binding cassette, subfamily B, bacterial MsbA
VAAPAPINTPADDKKQTLETYAFLGQLLRPYWFRALIAAVITIPIGMLDGTIAFVLKPYVDGMQTGVTSAYPVEFIPLIIVGFTAFQGLLNYTSIYLNGWLGFKIMSDLRSRLFTRLQTMDVAYFHNTPTGNLIQGYFRDPESLQANVLNNAKDVLTRLFSSIFLASVLISISWKLSIIAISVLLLVLYPSTLIRKKIKQFARASNAAAGDILSYYTETAGGIQVIYGFNQQALRLKRFQASQKGLFAQTMKHIKAQGWLTPSMHTIASVGVGIVIWQGSVAVVSKEMTTGSFVSFIAALLMLYNPVKNLGGSMMNAQLSMLAATRMKTLLDSQPTIQDPPDPLTLDTITQGIQLAHVQFGYTPGVPVLHDLSLTLDKGETVALVGSSGCGKSTLASLLMRFYDVDRGQILVDGHDIRQYSLHSLRQQMALVTQDNFLFDGTIQHNLQVGRANATEADMWQALEQAYLKPFVSSLDLGLNTRIGERGVMLSGGQRQRLAIARAILKDAPIVILDEATSALDNESEGIVQQAMERLMTDRTVLVIAHRLSTIRNADRIVVMDAGRVVEMGTHTELMANPDGRYAFFYNTQFSRLADPTPADTDRVAEPLTASA